MATQNALNNNIGVATGTSLNLGSSTTMTGMIDDDTMATASSSTAASSESIRNYVGSTVPLADGVAKMWINFNGTGTIAINDSFNVAGITDNGTGYYTVTIATDFANVNYSTVIGCNRGDHSSYNQGLAVNLRTPLVGEITFWTGILGAADALGCFLASFGDQ